MLGRILCRLGLHHRTWADATDNYTDHAGMREVTKVSTYTWCKRPKCECPTTVVNVDFYYHRLREEV